MDDKEFNQALEAILNRKKQQEEALEGCLKAVFDAFFFMLLGGIITYVLMRLGTIS